MYETGAKAYEKGSTTISRVSQNAYVSGVTQTSKEVIGTVGGAVYGFGSVILSNINEVS